MYVVCCEIAIFSMKPASDQRRERDGALATWHVNTCAHVLLAARVV